MLRLFVSNTGNAWRELNVGVNEDPYHLLDSEGRKVINSDGSWVSQHVTTLFAKWSIETQHEGTFSSLTPFLIYPSPDERFLVVVFIKQKGFASPEFLPPHNALVLNADGTVRHHLRQPARYAGQNTEFLYPRWYERNPPSPPPPWWAFWRKQGSPPKETRMKLLIGWTGDPCMSFEAVDFDPETGEFGEVVDSGRL